MEKILACAAFACESRVAAADDGDPGQPGIVELCCRLVQVLGAGKVADREGYVDIRVVVPLGGVTDDKLGSGLAFDLVGEGLAREFWGKIPRVPEKRDGLDLISAGRIAGDEIRLCPKWYENRTRKSAGMGAVLDDLELSAGVGDEVRDDVCDELFFSCAKVGVEEISKCDDDPFVRHFCDEFDRSFTAQFDPSLVDPTLCRGGFSPGEEIGGVAGNPSRLSFRARQMGFGHVERNIHLIAA